MTKTSCERSGFPVPMRWLRAGGDLDPIAPISARIAR